MTVPSLAERAGVASHVDFAPQAQPPPIRLVVTGATVAVVASVALDAALAVIATHAFPSTKGFSHFRFFDYATLTLIGIVLATPVWPLVARITSTPRWLFARLAVAATAVLWLPDLYLLFVKHETTRGVAVLMVMHLSVALITYNALVRIAPTRSLTPAAEPNDPRALLIERSAPEDGGEEAFALTRAGWRGIWVAMLGAVSIEFTVGVVALLFVPASRPSVWVPERGRLVYLVHGVFGAAVLIGAIVALVVANGLERRARIGANAGFLGVVIAAAGGLFAVDHGLRLLGMALMFIGTGVAFFGYLVPLVEPQGDGEAEHEATA